MFKWVHTLFMEMCWGSEVFSFVFVYLLWHINLTKILNHPLLSTDLLINLHISFKLSATNNTVLVKLLSNIHKDVPVLKYIGLTVHILNLVSKWCRLGCNLQLFAFMLHNSATVKAFRRVCCFISAVKMYSYNNCDSKNKNKFFWWCVHLRIRLCHWCIGKAYSPSHRFSSPETKL